MKTFDSIVIGAGHAGVESALALARTNNKTLLLTLNLDSVSFLACNPSIGGTGKGHLVCEIDALGGQMGISADKNILQLRMLNLGKGPAVHSLRAQIDKQKYHETMKHVLETQKNLQILQVEASEILVENGKVCGVKVTSGECFGAKSVVIATGVYLNSRTITGEWIKNSGPNGFQNATELTKSLINLGFKIRRFKTGTPPRIDKKTVNYSVIEEQCGDENIQNFSFLTKKPAKNICKCYLTYTTQETKDVILKNLHRAPMYSGEIKGVGPRYCPSIETKIDRFKDKERHQVFLEPESLGSDEIYLQGASTSMPYDVQYKIVNSIIGLENAEIMRFAYAIEYDCIDSLDLYPTLGYKRVKGLYTAGQINGTSGYEEAAAQGIIAGINASLYNKNKQEIVLSRDNSYIGVLIDDICTKGTTEPYRMMTSRAEYRLWLRQDNADMRLTEIGREVGLVDSKRYKNFLFKKEEIKKIKEEIKKVLPPTNRLNEFLLKNGETKVSTGFSISSLIKRSNIDIFKIAEEFNIFNEYSTEALNQVNIECKYEGYLAMQKVLIEKQQKLENKVIPENFNYSSRHGLRIEAIQKLEQIRPLTVGQASRIYGVNPADITVLLLLLGKN
ncbi:MAG: tRNA uridine-5-carboxymethylaminomethyl(34) synthesis enzyme MnmG [Clostridia bacterium]